MSLQNCYKILIQTKIIHFGAKILVKNVQMSKSLVKSFHIYSYPWMTCKIKGFLNTFENFWKNRHFCDISQKILQNKIKCFNSKTIKNFEILNSKLIFFCTFLLFFFCWLYFETNFFCTYLFFYILRIFTAFKIWLKLQIIKDITMKNNSPHAEFWNSNYKFELVRR